MSRKFLFLSVNSSFSHSSLALPMLHNAAKDVHGWHWELLECTINEDNAEIALKAAEKFPDLLGCSLYIFNTDFVMDVLSRFHALCPGCKIIIGGPECAGDAAFGLLQRYPFIDTVFRGEAEGLFTDYLKNFPDNAPHSVIPACSSAYYEKWTDTFPVNDTFFCASKAFVQMETSRGCPMGCKYCTSSNIPLRLKDLNDVKKEIELLQSKGIREIRLLDRTFNVPQSRGAALLKIFRENFADIEFHLEIHPQFLNDELKSELSNATNLHIEAGIQSFDENVQQAIGRNSKRDEVIDGIRFLTSCDKFETHVDLICGLPEQTLDSILSDTALLIRLEADEIQLETLKILHGTPLEKECKKYGIIHAPAAPYDVMQTKSFSASQILYARKLSRVLDLFHNHPVLRNVFRKLNFKNGNDVRIFLDFMIGLGIDIKQISDLKKRVIYLAEFIKKHSSSEAGFELAKVWISQGYPMNDIPFGTVEKFAGELPADITPQEKAILYHRETKLWQLSCGESKMIFALNRHFKLNGAAWSRG